MKTGLEKSKKLKVFSLVAIFLIIASFVFVSVDKGFLRVTKADFFNGIPGTFFDATIYNNIRGWSWSGFLGWTSFSCQNQGVCGSTNYGVHMVRNSDLGFFGVGYDVGALVGHAWSDGVGWISFNKSEANADGTMPNDLFPARSYMAKVDILQNNQISGWARAMMASSLEENWNGWIKLAGDGGTWTGVACTGVGGSDYSNSDRCNYGVKIGVGGDFEGYAWGGEAVGWISFNNLTGGGTNNYKVYIADNPIPRAENLASNFVDMCLDNKNPRFTFQYFSDIGFNLAKYDIEIIKFGGDFAVPFKTITDATRNDISGSVISIIYPNDDLDRNFAYNWRVRVRDQFGSESLWVEDSNYPLNPDFSIELNKRPLVSFDWDPKVIIPNIDVAFTSTGISRCYNGDTARDCTVLDGDSFLWSIQDSVYTVGDPTVADPTVQFTSSGAKAISLEIRGSGFGVGEECSITAVDILGGSVFDVSKPIPTFEEQRP
jgi:hypothetical protein